MSRVPPPLPPTPPPIPGPPKKPLGKSPVRAQGDLSDAELAALLPPEPEEDEEHPHALPPPIPGTVPSVSRSSAVPPLHTAVPPPPLSGIAEIVSVVPPPVWGTEQPEADRNFPKPGKSRALTPQQRALFSILFGSFLCAAILIGLMVFVFGPGENPPPTESPASIGQPSDETSPGSAPRKTFDLENAPEVEFIDPDHTAIPRSSGSETRCAAKTQAMFWIGSKLLFGILAGLLQTDQPTTANASTTPQLAAGETKTFAGHRSPITSVAMSPDGRVAVTGSVDRTAILWSLETGKELRQINAARSSVTAVVFSRDGSYFFTGSNDRSASLWITETGREVRQFLNHKGSISALAPSPDGDLLVVGVENGQGVVWDAKTGKPLKPLDEHSKAISAIAYAPDNKRIVLASLDKTLSVWNPIKGEKLVDFKKHDGPVGCVAFDSNGNRIVSGSADKTAIIWNSRDGRELLRLEGHTAEVVFVAFAPDGETVYTASKDKTFVQWNARNGKPLVRCRLETAPLAVAMSADAFQMISCGEVDSKAMVFRTESLGFFPPGKPPATFKEHPFTKLPTEKPISRFDPEPKKESEESAAKPLPKNNSVDFSPIGSLAVSVGSDSNGVVWNTQTDKTLYFFSHTASLTSVRFSKDGRTFACGASDGMVLVFQASTGEQIYKLRGHTAAVNNIAFSADGLRLLSAASDRTLVLWNLETGRSLGALLGHTDKVWDVAVSPDMSKAVSVSSDKTVRVWESSGKILKKLEDQAAPLISLVFAPNGDWFATGGEDKTVVVWDAKEFKPIKTLEGFTEPQRALAVKPDGSVLATGGGDGVAVFWNTQNWEPFHAFPQIPLEIEEKQLAVAKETSIRKKWTKEVSKPVDYEPIKSIAFSKDGRQLLTSGGVQTLLWNVENLTAPPEVETAKPSKTKAADQTPEKHPKADAFAALPLGKPIRRLEAFASAVLAADVSRDGSTIVVAEENKRVSWFEANTGKETFRFTARSPFEAVFLLPDGRSLLAGAQDGRFFSTAILNNLSVNKELFQAKVHTDRITSIETNATGLRAITGGADKIAVIWDTKKGENLGRLTAHKGEINTVALSRDSSKALTASEDRSAILWDVKTLKPIQTVLEHRLAVNGVAFSFDGFRFATASKDRTAIVFLTATGKELLRLTGSAAPLTCIAFAPDGNHLLTGAEDGDAILWDAKTGQAIKRFPPSSKPVLSVTFTGGGKQLFVVTPLDVTLWNVE